LSLLEVFKEVFNPGKTDPERALLAQQKKRAGGVIPCLPIEKLAASEGYGAILSDITLRATMKKVGIGE
jgi:hypothetical protein